MASSLPPDASAELNAIVSADSSKGVAVHSFDPEADPKEKAAVAAKARSKLAPIGSSSSSEKNPPRELAIDTGGTGKPPPPPTITIQHVDDEPPITATTMRSESVPGEMPQGLAHEIPDWFKIGWREVSQIDQLPVAQGDDKDKSILEAWVKEQYYGDWYHNAAVIFFAVAASHFLTVFRFGWGWLFLILIACSSYYSISMQRLRRRQRDDIQRELVKTRLVTESESADWMNNFLDRFWLIYEPVLSATIISSVDQILSTSTPAFLDSIRLSTFTLGNKAPRISSVKTYPDTPEDIITMDWAVSFTPSDVSDVTPAQAKKRVNPKIVLSVRIGKGFAGGTIPILLEDVEFSGEITVRMKLMTNFPHVQLVDLSFKQPPIVDYVLKPVGGETLGFDIAHIPGLSSFIRDMMHSTLGPMMYAPNKFTLNLEQMLSGAPLDAAIGVVQVTIHSARSLKGSKLGGGTPDPYVAMSISQRSVVAETSWKESTYNPTWNETKFILVNSLSDVLNFVVKDHNDHRSDTEIGAAVFELGSLQHDAVKPDLTSRLLKDGKERGELRYDITYYPVLKPQKTADGTEEPVPETSVGIVRLTVHQAKDLDASKSTSGDLNPFAKILLGTSKESIFSTPRVKHSNSPVWESSTEFLCADKASSYVTVAIVDDRSLLKDPVVGYKTIKLTELMDAKKDARDWFTLDGCRSGRVRLGVEWKPLEMAGSLQGANQYVPPIGVVRLWIQKAIEVKNVEAALGGKSDPYVRVLVNNIIEGRTEVINNDLNPQWDQIVYIPVHSTKEIMLLECMDYQHLTKDRSLGTTELRVSELTKESSSPEFRYEASGKKTAAEPLRLDRGNAYKGTLHYVAEFIPSINIAGVSFQDQPTELDMVLNGGGDGSDSSSSSSSSSSAVDVDIDIPMATSTGSTQSPMKSSVNVEEKKTPTERQADDQFPSDGSVSSKKTSSSKNGGIDMPKEELLKFQSGIVVCNIVGGNLAKKARLEILLDDGYWPACSTHKSTSTSAKWNYVGEGFIKELDFSRAWIRLNENEENEKESLVGELKIECMKFLEKAMDGPTSFTLEGVDGRPNSTVEIAAKYVPVRVELEARESINNQGILRVELLDAKNLHGADRSGKSDPFVVFTLNGEKVFKSQTKKKTLTPEWNETFTVQVPSRVGAAFSLEVFDWNQIEQAKSLGGAKIELADLEPFKGTERTLTLSHEKHGDDAEIRLALTFQPEIIAKSRKNTSTFSSAGRAFTQIGHMPFEGAKGVVHGVGSAGSRVTGIFKKDHAKGERSIESIPELPPVAGQVSQSGESPDVRTSFPQQKSVTNGLLAQETGILKITIFNGNNFSFLKEAEEIKEIKPYVVLKLGTKEHKTKHTSKTASPEWNETFVVPAGPETSNLIVEVLDHRTFGKDKLLAEGTVEVWKHVQPGGVTSADALVGLDNDQGHIRMRLEFERTNGQLGRGGSSLDLNRNGTPTSPSRFLSLRKKVTEE